MQFHPMTLIDFNCPFYIFYMYIDIVMYMYIVLNNCLSLLLCQLLLQFYCMGNFVMRDPT